MNDKSRGFEYGAFLLLASTLIVKVIGAVFKIPLSNLLGDLGFGCFSSGYDLFIPIYTLAMAGLPVAVSRAVSERYAAGDNSGAFYSFVSLKRFFVVLGAVITIISLVIAYPLCLLTDKSGQSFYAMIFVTPSIFFCFILSAYRGYFEGRNNMVPTAVSDVILALSKLVLGYTFAYAVLKLTDNVFHAAGAAVFGITVGTAIACVYTYFRYKKGRTKTNKTDFNKSLKADKKLLLAVVPIMLSSLSVCISALIDALTVRSAISLCGGSFSLGGYTGGNLANALYGIRGKAYTLFNLVPAFCSVIGVSAVPVLSAAREKGNKPDINTSLKYTCIISLPAGLGLCALAPQIMSLLYKQSTLSDIGARLLFVYGTAAIFAGISVYFTSVLISYGKQNAALFIIIAGALVKLLLNLVLCSDPDINILGAAISALFCYLLILLLDFAVFIRAFGGFPDILNCFLKPLFAAVICCTAAYFVAGISEKKVFCVLAIAVAVCLYSVLLSVFKTLSKEELANLKKMIKN